MVRADAMKQAYPTNYWHAVEGGKVQCDLCPNHCRLREGERGICFVRRAVDGQVALTTYGRISGRAADPIEKKPLYHFLPGTRSLSFGNIGCNLSCRFCQNWRISKPRGERGLLEEATPEELADAAVDAGCPSVSFTYNEPLVTFEYTLDVARACRARGLRTVAVTAGYIEPEPRREFFALMDAANVDLKAFRESFYRRMSGVRLAPVLDTLRYVRRETSVWLEVTTLLVPGENDGAEELEEQTRWCVEELGPEVPLHFSAFHPTYRLTDRPPTSVRTLREACRIARGNGARYVYTGNVYDPDGSTTRCHHCGAPLIERNGMRAARVRLEHGGCPDCATPCAGVFQ